VGGGAWTNLRIAMRNNMRMLFPSPTSIPNGFQGTVKHPFKGDSADQCSKAMEMFGLQAWTLSPSQARIRNDSGEVQEAVLCDHPDFLRQRR
jgi:hypothetical protein